MAAWPQVVLAGRADKEPMLNLSNLTATQKQHVWAALKRDAPGMISVLTDLQELAKHFDGQMLVKIKDLPPSVLALTGKTK